jgi:hypothetical protein
MIIADFKRDAENKIIALDAKGKEAYLDFDYVAKHKPQVGDDYPAHKPAEEVTEEPAAPAA